MPRGPRRGERHATPNFSFAGIYFLGATSGSKVEDGRTARACQNTEAPKNLISDADMQRNIRAKRRAIRGRDEAEIKSVVNKIQFLGPGRVARTNKTIGCLDSITSIKYVCSGSDVNAGMENRALIAWVDNYCRADPLRPIVTTAYMLVEELKKRADVR